MRGSTKQPNPRQGITTIAMLVTPASFAFFYQAAKSSSGDYYNLTPQAKMRHELPLPSSQILVRGLLPHHFLLVRSPSLYQAAKSSPGDYYMLASSFVTSLECPTKQPNPRQGITTRDGARKRSSNQTTKQPNPRQGITTYSLSACKRSSSPPTKQPNPRQGIANVVRSA